MSEETMECGRGRIMGWSCLHPKIRDIGMAQNHGTGDDPRLIVLQEI
jgi:hypothetical protein